MPLVSVILPSYNHQQYIEETLQSIWAQSYPDIEIVVVDDCSTDLTYSILQKLQCKSPFPMKVYQNKQNLGPAKSINKALHLCSGDFFTPFASDDLFMPHRYEKQIQMFQENQSLRIVYGNGYAFDGTDILFKLHEKDVVRLFSKEPAEVLTYLYTHVSRFTLQTALIKRDFVVSIGGWDEGGFADDWVLNIKMFQRFHDKSCYGYVDEDLVHYRIHGSNIHKNFERQKKLLLEVIKKYTPLELQKMAKSNIFWDIGVTALAKEGLWDGIKWLSLSQWIRPDIQKVFCLFCKAAARFLKAIRRFKKKV